MKRILIVDDDVAITNYMMVFLMQTGRFESTVVNDSREVAGLLAQQSFDIIMLDMDMPHVSGMDILNAMREQSITTPVIILTGVSDVDLAVKSMKLGAYDYLTKPVEEDHLLEIIDAALEHKELHRSIDQLPAELTRADLACEAAFARFPTQDAEIIRLLHQAEKMAASNLNIFLIGENGTGKEALARAIHGASPRGKEPFVAVDADAQDPERFSADVFGQARLWGGEREEQSGFLEAAAGGTLYIGNIEHMTRPMQVRLKRVLQTGEYYRENSTRIRKSDACFVLGAGVDLTDEAHRETFSRDLIYHLMVNSITLPPLRERIEDLSLIAGVILDDTQAKVGKQLAGFGDDFFSALKTYDFPDNIQELRNIIEGSAVNTEDGERITADALPRYIRQKLAAEPAAAKPAFQPRSLAEVQREYVTQTLEHLGNDHQRAAQELGITVEELGTILKG